MIVKLKEDLHDYRITSICNNIFRSIKPEEENCDTYIEYRLIIDTDDYFAGNKNLVENHIIQIDIFSYGSYRKLAKVLKDTLKDKGYLYAYGMDSYEDDTKLYHRAMRFKYNLFVGREG